jgi:drug/metabolite transporter (DMT)-like permease
MFFFTLLFALLTNTASFLLKPLPNGHPVAPTRRVSSSSLFSLQTKNEAPIVMETLEVLETDDFPPNIRILALGMVPLLWGTYSPVVKTLYNTASIPPPAIVFNVMSHFVCFSIMSSIPFILDSAQSINSSGAVKDSTSSKELLPLDVGAAQDLELEASTVSTPKQVTSSIERIGAELGTWLFLGSTIQVLGIQETSATRAGVLVQMTTVFVPLIESFINRSTLSPRLWLSTLLAICGILLVGLQDPEAIFKAVVSGDSIGGVEMRRGDVFVILSAVAYSMHVIRLGKFAEFVDPTALARAKSRTELLLGLFAGAVLTATGSTEIAQYAGSLWSNTPDAHTDLLIAAVVWNGAITTGLTMWLQTFGQKAMLATQANLIYSTQPIYGLVISSLFLHETFSKMEAMGCGVLLGAVFLATSATRSASTASATSAISSQEGQDL